MALAVVLSASVFTSCNKDDDPQPALEYKTEGSIKGKITGTSKDNAYTFNDEFNYSQYSILTGSYATYTVETDGSYDFTISRSDFATTSTARLQFTLANAGSTTPLDSDVTIQYIKEVDNKLVTFSMSSGGSNTTSITELTFDSSTGVIKGKYSLSGTNNSTTKSASVTGDFNVTAK